VVAIALLIGGLLARWITRPLRELTVAAGEIAAGNLDRRVPVRSRDELGVLAVQFNQMSADLERAKQLRRQTTADIAHDLRTPLTVLSGYLEALHDEVLKPTPARFATLYAETQLLLRLVEDLHTLALADAGELRLVRQAVAPGQLLERVAAAHQHAAAQQGVDLQVQAPEPMPEVWVDPERMNRVLTNLVGNALRYTPAGGRVTLSVHTTPAQVQMIVADTGSGIVPEHLPNIFERFYRADPARQAATGGSGLGLAIVKSLVEAHGGQIAVASTLGQGTAFTIVLPTG
jgi:signal transduction histidine kinase